MRIVLFSRNFFPLFRGIEINTYILAKYFAQIGNDVTVISPMLDVERRNIKMCEMEADNKNMKVKIYELPKRKLKLHLTHDITLYEVFQCKRILSEPFLREADLVFVFQRSTLLPLLLSNINIPISVSIHVPFKTDSIFKDILVKKTYLNDRVISRFVFTQTKSTISYFLRFHNTFYMQQPIEIERFKRTKPLDMGDKDAVLMIGALEPEKGIYDFLKVANRFRDRKDVQFIIVGSGSLENLIKQFAKRLPILHIPSVPYFDPKLYRLYKTAKVFLSTATHQGINRTEIEALCAGCSLIKLNPRDIPTFYEQYILPVYNIEDAVYAIKKVLSQGNTYNTNYPAEINDATTVVKNIEKRIVEILR